MHGHVRGGVGTSRRETSSPREGSVMRGVFGCLGGAAAVALGLLTTTAGRAQEKLPQPAKPAARETAPPGGVHRMVIRNGAVQTVHYIAGRDVSPGDAATLRDLEGAENEAMYAHDLQR